MVEVHGWITLRETYKLVEEENIEGILEKIQREIDSCAYPSLQIKVNNGEYFIEFSRYANHRSGDVTDLLSLFETVGRIAEGSYGLLYMHDDEDREHYNDFVVYRLARGRVTVFQDSFLSPLIPVVEDGENPE